MRRLRIPRSPKVIVGLIILGFFLLLTIIGPYLAPFDPNNTSFAPNLTPSVHHWFGTTSLGQDIFSQTLVGARATMVVALVAGLVATMLSVVIGVSAGYLGGYSDDGLSLLSNVFLALPGLPLLIVIDSYLPVNSRSNSIVIGLIISLTGWAWGARVLRAQTMSLRNRDFVESSRIIGESRLRIMFTEVVPNLLPIMASSLLFTILYSIGAYVTLAYVGLTSTSVWNWGTMLFWAQANNAPLSGEWYWFVPPGICIALVGTSLALLNFGIDEFINPRLREGGLSARQRRRAGPAASATPRVYPGASTSDGPVAAHANDDERDGAMTTDSMDVGADVRVNDVADDSSSELTPRVASATLGTGSSMGERILDVRNFSVDYGWGENAVRAVDNVDVHLERSKVLGIAGESGSGKSTLVYAITRLLRAPGVITSGEARFNLGSRGGPEIVIDLVNASETELRAIRWSSISIVLQSALNALNPVLRVGAQFEQVLNAHRGELSKDERRIGRPSYSLWSGSARTDSIASPTNSPAVNDSAS